MPKSAQLNHALEDSTFIKQAVLSYIKYYANKMYYVNKILLSMKKKTLIL